jgi:hypothetical protein
MTFVFAEIEVIDEGKVYLGGKPCLHRFFEYKTEEEVPVEQAEELVVD